ncbi:MAG TPA: nitronate monooxygenase [Candidatus Angelobacter sp.]|nr:nitronate monooxygenase [Candidatus Angelobacter sp.]
MSVTHWYYGTVTAEGEEPCHNSWMSYPTIIQGGMGAGVSDWRLANAVSREGQLGVVSGTALDQILVRRLQDGDRGGNILHALGHFPFPVMAERIWKTYYVPGGKQERESYKAMPMHAQESPRELQELCMVANFAEVFLASRGHENPVGINFLEKIQLPLLPSLYGAMLAGVDYVLMGAGIPLKVPGALDRLARHEPAAYPLAVTGALPGEDFSMTFNPRDFMERDLPALRRPKFLAIIASNTLATTMVKKANGKVDGFVIEGPRAGGHNAPPRGKVELNEQGEPVYGERDRVDLARIRELGLPFWLAGEYGSPEKVQEALAAGAAGVQVGTAFAFCEESGLRKDFKRRLMEQAIAGEARVFTDPVASPTGFPFKVAQLEGSLSEQTVYESRPRICDLGYLREAYRTAEGKVDFRCPGEPVTLYTAKGGAKENTAGRKCLCNALVANIGQPQVRNGKHVEAGLVTSGDDLKNIPQFLEAGETSYSAADVIGRLLENSPRTTEKDMIVAQIHAKECRLAVSPHVSKPLNELDVR